MNWKFTTFVLICFILEISQSQVTEAKSRKILFFPSANNRDVHLVFSEIAKNLLQNTNYSATFVVHSLNADALNLKNTTTVLTYGDKDQQNYAQALNEARLQFQSKSLLSLRAYNESNYLLMNTFSQSKIMTKLVNVEANVLICDSENFLCEYLAKKLSISKIVYYSKTMFNIYWMDYFEMHPSSHPVPNSAFTNQMDFKQRVQNLINYYKLFLTGKYQKRLGKQAILSKEEDAAKLSLEYNKDALYISEDVVTLSYPFSYPPNFAPLGCIGCVSKKPFSNFLQQFVNQNSKLVLVKFGNIMSDQESQVLVGVLTKYPKIGFILRGTIDENVETPSNIFKDKNGNTADILSLIKTSAFIHDGDHSSFLEGVYFKKPMIVLPHNHEGQANGALIRERGLGVFIEDEEDFTIQNLDQAMNEVVNNSGKFKRNLLVNSRRIPKGEAFEGVDRIFDFYLTFGSENLSVSPYHNMANLEYYNIDIMLMTTMVVIFFCYWVGRLGMIICGRRKKAPKIKIELTNS